MTMIGLAMINFFTDVVLFLYLTMGSQRKITRPIKLLSVLFFLVVSFSPFIRPSFFLVTLFFCTLGVSILPKKAIKETTFLLPMLLFALADMVPIGLINSMGIPNPRVLVLISGLTGGISLLIKLKVFSYFKRETPSQTKSVSTNPVLLMALISIPLLSVILFGIALVSDINLTANPEALVTIVLICLVYVNLCIVYLYLTLKKNINEIAEAANQQRLFESELAYTKKMIHSQEKMASLKHDLKNQYILLLGMLQQQRYQEATNYLQLSLTDVERSDTFFTNNPVLNFLLNEKKGLAEQAGIHLTVKALLPQQLKLNNDILAVVLGNLIDNSLNAVKRLPSPQGKTIALTIKLFNDNLLIDISNDFDISELTTRQTRLSQGIGLKNIKRVIEEHNGIYEQWVVDQQYVVSILLMNII